MNAEVKVDGIIPFNAYAAYEREREENRRLYDLLTRSLMLLESETYWRERHGMDTSGLKAFIKEARA